MLEEIYQDLPDQSELAFLKIEGSYREACDVELNKYDLSRETPIDVYLAYMTRTMSAAEALGLNFFDGWDAPNSNNISELSYRDFRGAVDGARTKLQIALSRRDRTYSVAFDVTTKSKISHFIQQIRVIVQKLEVDEWKKDALLNKLNEFQAEVDRNRSQFAVFGALVIEISGVIGTAAERLEPVRRHIDSIAGLIWGTKHTEQNKLPPPPTPKRIPPPAKPKKAERKRNGLDDDIPF